MFILYANKTQLTVRRREPMTSGSVNVYQVQFDFSEDWDGLTKTAVFRAGRTLKSVLLDDISRCELPWEVLADPERLVMAGVYGTRNDDMVLPTCWASLGTVLEGAIPGTDARPPTPDLWEQELAGKADGLSYDGLNLSLMSGDKTLSSVEIVGGGNDGGVSDHRLLSHRDAQNQHPIEAIAGLENELMRIPDPTEPITNSELEALLK